MSVHQASGFTQIATQRLASALLVTCLLWVLLVEPACAQTPQTATVLDSANLRAGPGTSFAVTGSARAGDTVRIVGSNAAGDWRELATGQWIAAFLVRIESGDAVVSGPFSWT